MLHSVLIFLGLVTAIAGLSLAFLSQRYWFARTWRLAGRANSAAWRKRLRVGLIAVVAVVTLVAVAAAAENMRGVFPRSSWKSILLSLWLLTSILSYLFIKI